MKNIIQQINKKKTTKHMTTLDKLYIGYSLVYNRLRA